MILNSFNSAFRQLIKNRVNTLINVLGLGIGLAGALLLFAVIRFEYSFEAFRPHADSIFRIVSETNRGSEIFKTPGVPFPFQKSLAMEFPDLRSTVLFVGYNNQITIPAGEVRATEDRKFKEPTGLVYVQPSLFSIINFSWLQGRAAALNDLASLALSEGYARKYFGSWQNAIGKSVQIDHHLVYKVAGVFADPLPNTDFQVQIAASYNSLPKDEDWGSTYSNRMVYIQIPDKLKASNVEERLVTFQKKHEMQKMADPLTYMLDPLMEMHYETEYSTISGSTMSKSVIISLTLIASFMVFIACINFVNLATAQSYNRAKESGVRKVLGSSKTQLVFLYLTEAFLVCSIAIMIAIGISSIAFNPLKTLLGLPEQVSFFESSTFILLGGLLILITFLSGLYPAFVLSSFQPSESLKGKWSTGGTNQILFRRILLSFQFVVSLVLIICTLVVIRQMNYMEKAELGFDKTGVVMIPVPADSLGYSRIKTLRAQLQEISAIEKMSFSSVAPLSQSIAETSFGFSKSTENEKFPAIMKFADADYFKTYQLKFLAGRSFNPSDTVTGYVMNETMLYKLGLKKPQDAIGRLVRLNGKTKPIVGVVKDYHDSPLNQKIGPILISSNLTFYQTLGIKLNLSSFPQSLDQIRKIWAKTYPEYVFESSFLNADIASDYDTQKRLSVICQIFSILSVFIACLGLYGMISFMLVQKKKEIGIRKVLGATITQIIYLFTSEFIGIVAVAFIAAVPISWYFMRDWLSEFQYHVSLSWLLFFGAGLLALCIAVLTVSIKAFQAARVNPSVNLRVD